MKFLSSFVKESIPNYLSNLPIPDSFRGWCNLRPKDWLALIPPTAACAGVTYLLYQTYYIYIDPPDDEESAEGTTRNMDVIKGVDLIDVEDIADHICLCRCSKSDTKLYCDCRYSPSNGENGFTDGPALCKCKVKKQVE